MYLYGKLADVAKLHAKAKAHLALAKEGILPVTNFYAAFRLSDQAAQIVEGSNG
jgi:hypothetical protein